MINELYSLGRTLDAVGIDQHEWHREYKELRKVTHQSPCIRLWLADDGSVCELESIDAELARELRKFGNNQESFPAFNINPLYRLVEEGSQADFTKLERGQGIPDLEMIKSWCVQDNWREGLVKKIERSLHDRANTLLAILGKQGQPDNSVMAKLAELCNKLRLEVDGGFRGSLEKIILEKLGRREDVGLLLPLLFHKGTASKAHEVDVGTPFTIFLDVRRWEQFGRPVAHKETTNQVNQLLLANGREAAPLGGMNLARDAFGTDYEIAPKSIPMPVVKVPGFDVILRSMYKGQPSQKRYGRIEDRSYPLAAENRALVKRSLEWIVEHPRGETWDRIDMNEVVFVYPSKIPEVPLKFAQFFAAPTAHLSQQTSARFESIAKEFATVFRGLPPSQKADSIQIFAIRKMDKVRRKVVFTRSTTPEQLIEAAEDWTIGCQNLPQLEIGEIVTPFPLGVARIVNEVWKQDGTRASGKRPVQRMTYYQGMELLLGSLPEGALHSYLHVTVVNSSGLVSHLGNLLHGIEARKKKKALDKREIKSLDESKAEVAQVLSVLALLLHKCSYRKERYMEELAYQLGQILQISDELHMLYCKHKRDGAIPPQLVGNSLFTTACEMPYQALSQLGPRAKYYIAWANQYGNSPNESEDEERWKARWLLRLYKRVFSSVAQINDKSVRFGDYEKAQVFIGYMVSLPKREKNEKVDAIAESAAGHEAEVNGGVENE